MAVKRDVITIDKLFDKASKFDPEDMSWQRFTIASLAWEFISDKFPSYNWVASHEKGSCENEVVINLRWMEKE